MQLSSAGLNSPRRMLIAVGCMLFAMWMLSPESRFFAVFTLLAFGPGYLLERRLQLDPQALLLRSSLWFGLSVSLIALGYQWAQVSGIALSGGTLLLLWGGLIVALAWQLWRDAAQPWATLAPQRRDLWLLLGLICGLSVWARFGEIAGLAFPVWVDSVHHGLLIRVAAERGAPPTDLRPLMPITALPYHWGYHVFLASMLNLSGLDLPRLILWAGQLLNALHAPFAGALALLLYRRPLAAVVAATIVGFVSLMPAYYVSWGRYTQLTGLLLLPALALSLQQALEGNRRRWWLVFSLLLAGLNIVHFRVLVFGSGLLALQILWWGLTQPWAIVRSRMVWAGAAGLGALALDGPWVWLLIQHALLPAVAQPQTLVIGNGYNDIRPEILWSGLNEYLFPLALLAALWGLRRQRGDSIIIGWLGLMLLIANPQLLNRLLLPLGLLLLLICAERGQRRAWLSAGGAGVVGGALVWFALRGGTLPAIYLFTNDAALISFFLPAAVLLGGGTARLFAQIAANRPKLSHWLSLGLVIGISVWRPIQLDAVVNQSTVLATPADSAALAWIAEHTAPDARFLINATPWIGVTDRGVDGGWWIMPITGRWTSLPPALYHYGDADYFAQIEDFAHTMAQVRADNVATVSDLIERYRINYIYIGSERGALRTAAARTLPNTTVVYEANGVTILAVGNQP